MGVMCWWLAKVRKGGDKSNSLLYPSAGCHGVFHLIVAPGADGKLQRKANHLWCATNSIVENNILIQ